MPPTDRIRTAPFDAAPLLRVTVTFAVALVSLTPYVALLNRNAPPASLSLMVRTAVDRGPSTAGPVGVDSWSSTVSGGSASVSLTIGTEKVLLV